MAGWRSFRGVLCSIFLVLFALIDVQSQTTLTWTGGGSSDNWSDPNNWDGVNIPDATHNILVFGNSARNTPYNDIAGLTVWQMSFGGTTNYTFSGNSFTLGNSSGPSDAFYIPVGSGGAVTVNNNVTLGSNQQWFTWGTIPTFTRWNGNIDTNGFALTIANASLVDIYGNISGSGSLTKTMSSFLRLYGASNTVGGGTTINGGWLMLYSDLDSDVQALIGGRLYGFNSVINGDLLVSGLTGDMLVPANLLTVNGNVTAGGGFGAGLTFNLSSLTDVNTGTAGVDWSLLSLSGSYNLTYLTGASLYLNMGALDPNSGDPFWNSSHLWLAGELENGVLDRSGLTISNAGWSTGNFGLLTLNGNDLYLYWNPVPEPSTWMMLAGFGAGVLVLAIRRRLRQE